MIFPFLKFTFSVLEQRDARQNNSQKKEHMKAEAQNNSSGNSIQEYILDL